MDLTPNYTTVRTAAWDSLSFNLNDKTKEELILNWLKTKDKSQVQTEISQVGNDKWMTLRFKFPALGDELSEYLESFRPDPWKNKPKLTPMQQAVDDFKYYLDSIPTTDWFEAGDAENPEEMVGWALQRVSEENQVNRNQLLTAVKKLPEWQRFLSELKDYNEG